MNGILKAIILGVTISSLLGAVALTLVPDGVLKEVTRFAAGLLIANSLFLPIAKLNLFSFSLPSFLGEQQQIQSEITLAQNQSKQMLAQITAEQMESYFLSELEQRGYECDLTISVQIEQDDTVQVEEVLVEGNNLDTQSITAFFVQECGITKEKILYVECETTE